MSRRTGGTRAPGITRGRRASWTWSRTGREAAETEFRGSAFPNRSLGTRGRTGVWGRGETACPPRTLQRLPLEPRQQRFAFPHQLHRLRGRRDRPHLTLGWVALVLLLPAAA